MRIAGLLAVMLTLIKLEPGSVGAREVGLEVGLEVGVNVLQYAEPDTSKK